MKRKTLGLLGLALAVLPGCASQKQNYDPIKPIVTEKTVFRTKISGLDLLATKAIKPILLANGLTEEEYQKTISYLEENKGKETSIVYKTIRHPLEPRKDEIILTTVLGDIITDYIDQAKDGFLLEKTDSMIDRIDYFPNGRKHGAESLTEKDLREYNERLKGLLEKHGQTLKNFLEK